MVEVSIYNPIIFQIFIRIYRLKFNEHEAARENRRAWSNFIIAGVTWRAQYSAESFAISSGTKARHVQADCRKFDIGI